MTPHEALKSVLRDWEWAADPKRDRWGMPPLTGPFTGDCEEFALAVLLRHAGTESVMFAMLAKGTARIERVLSDRGVGHAVLWIEGAGYVDSIHQFWRHNRVFEHKQTFTERDVRRKLEGKTVRGPANKKMLMLAALVGVGGMALLFGGFLG